MARKATYQGLGEAGSLVEHLSTASTALTLTDDQQGKWLVWNGQAAASRIRLPAPEAGMVYRILLNGPAVSSATKILSSGVYDIRTGNSTAKGVAAETTVENGQGFEFVALNDVRWHASRVGGSTLAITSTTT